MKNKNSRKEFIKKTAKVAGGLVLCPAFVSVIQSCSKDPVSSDSVDGMFSECPCHYARFDTDGNPIQGPASEPLQGYSSELIEGNSLIIDESLSVDVEDLEIGSAMILESNNVDASGLLIYRKSEGQFNVLSRECTHEGCPVGPFQ